MAEQMTEQMMMQQQGQPPQAELAPQPEPIPGPQQEQAPEQSEGGASEVHERFILNVMKLASGDQYDKVMAFLKSGQNPAQNFGKALFFILQAVKVGLEKKDVQIPGELWLSENGLIEQSAKIIGILAVKDGVQLDKESMSEGMELAAEALAETDDMQEQQTQEQPGPSQGQAQQQPVPPQQSQQSQPQPPQQQGGGLLTRAGAMQ